LYDAHIRGGPTGIQCLLGGQAVASHNGRMEPYYRYSYLLRSKMADSANRQGRAISIRELSVAIGRSYELCRLVLRGHPAVSEAFNHDACELLGLDEAEMWKIAAAEKVRRGYGAPGRPVAVPPDERLARAWERLDASGRERVIRIAEQIANRPAKPPSDNDEP